MCVLGVRAVCEVMCDVFGLGVRITCSVMDEAVGPG